MNTEPEVAHATLEKGGFVYLFNHKGKKHRYLSNGSSSIEGAKSIHDNTICYHGAIQNLNQEMTGIGGGYGVMDMNFTMQARLMDRKDVHFQAQDRPYIVIEDKPPKINVLPTYESSDVKPDSNNKSFFMNALNAHKNAKDEDKAERIVVPIALEGGDKVNHMTGVVIEPPKTVGGKVKVFYFDPLGSGSGYGDLKNDVIKALEEVYGKDNLEVVSNKFAPERDGKSCGPWTEWFLTEIASDSSIKFENLSTQMDDKLKSVKDKNEHLNNFIDQRYQENKIALQQIDGKLTGILKQANVNIDGAEPSKTITPTKQEADILKAMTKAFDSHFKDNEKFKNTKIEKDKNGHEIIVKKIDKELFRANSTTVSTKDTSDDNLKAMSEVIVANYKTRLMQGGNPDKLKISVGECHPEGVHEKFAGFINAELKKMRVELSGKTNDKGDPINIDKVKDVPVTSPKVTAQVESEKNTEKEKQTKQQDPPRFNK